MNTHLPVYNNATATTVVVVRGNHVVYTRGVVTAAAVPPPTTPPPVRRQPGGKSGDGFSHETSRRSRGVPTVVSGDGEPGRPFFTVMTIVTASFYGAAVVLVRRQPIINTFRPPIMARRPWTGGRPLEKHVQRGAPE